jgi:hypothetical protein
MPWARASQSAQRDVVRRGHCARPEALQGIPEFVHPVTEAPSRAL